MILSFSNFSTHIAVWMGRRRFLGALRFKGGMGVWMDVLSGDTHQINVKSVAFRLSFFCLCLTSKSEYKNIEHQYLSNAFSGFATNLETPWDCRQSLFASEAASTLERYNPARRRV